VKGSKWARLQHACLWIAALAGALGVATAAGFRVGAVPDPRWSWLLHALLLLLGTAGGIAAMMRGIEADRERFQVLQEQLLTPGERDYAHKRAERQRRGAGTIFLLAPVTVGYWLASHLSSGEPNFLSDSLVVTPLLGFIVGIFVGRWIEDRGGRPEF